VTQPFDAADLELRAIGIRSACARAAVNCVGGDSVTWDEIRESLADVQPLLARHRALQAERDAARAAAAIYRDELNHTGEKLLAVTAERDQLRERVDDGAWDKLLTDRNDYRAAVLGLANSLADAKAERDRLAETLRGADPYADTGLDRLAGYLTEHWPARTIAAIVVPRTFGDMAIDVLKDLCGQLAECYAELARMQPVVDAAVVWRHAGLLDADVDADLSAAVDTWTATPDGDTP
jgi:hypothetical protein